MGLGCIILAQVREMDIDEKQCCLGFAQGNDHVIEINENIQDIYLELELIGPDDE